MRLICKHGKSALLHNCSGASFNLKACFLHWKFVIEHKILHFSRPKFYKWLGLFTNKPFRKHRKLIYPHMDFVICIVSLAIFHWHFVIRIFLSAIYHRHFSICILSSPFFYPPSAAIRSALYRDPKKSVERKPHSRNTMKANLFQAGQIFIWFPSKKAADFPVFGIKHSSRQTKLHHWKISRDRDW